MPVNVITCSHVRLFFNNFYNFHIFYVLILPLSLRHLFCLFRCILSFLAEYRPSKIIFKTPLSSMVDLRHFGSDGMWFESEQSLFRQNKNISLKPSFLSSVNPQRLNKCHNGCAMTQKSKMSRVRILYLIIG